MKFILCQFKTDGQPFDYKTNLEDLRVGEMVVVQARGTYSVAEVCAVDTVPSYPEDKIRWAFQRVDIELVKRLEAGNEN
jgi:hypothetical protein